MGLYTISALAMSGLLGCQAADSSVSEKLDQIDQRLSSIEKRIAEGAAARPQMPQRPRAGEPDPSKVYAVPIAGAAFRGPEHAKVTIVEAFEFA